MMLLATTLRRTVFVSALALAVSCGRNTPASSVPASTAYADGFEVVVFDVTGGVLGNVRSMPLREAEQAMAEGAHALVPGDTATVERGLSAGKSGDSQVSVMVKQLDGSKQQVRVSFHESNRTFVYEYVVDGSHVTPIGSEYRDLAKSTSVRYSHAQ